MTGRILRARRLTTPNRTKFPALTGGQLRVARALSRMNRVFSKTSRLRTNAFALALRRGQMAAK
jgi:hypothetical protein